MFMNDLYINRYSYQNFIRLSTFLFYKIYSGIIFIYWRMDFIY